MLILGRRKLWAGGTREKGRDKPFFMHTALQLCYPSPSGWAHKCTIPTHTMPHTGIRLEESNIPNACGLLYPFSPSTFPVLAGKIAYRIMPLIWSNQTQQSTLWLVSAAQQDSTCSSPTDGSLTLTRLCWDTFKFRSGYQGKKGREHFSFSCVIHHYAVSPFSSRPNFSQKFLWNNHIYWIFWSYHSCWRRNSLEFNLIRVIYLRSVSRAKDTVEVLYLQVS